jgi:outer membrane protein
MHCNSTGILNSGFLEIFMKKTKLYLLVSLFSLAPFTANANSLMDVYEQALQNDSQLKADRAKYEAGLANKTISRAGLLPLINANATYSETDQDDVAHHNLNLETQFGADQQSLIVRVATAYFNVLSAIDNLEATIAEEQALAQQLEQAKQRFEVGLTAITEVHEAQAAYDSATAATLEARGLIGINFEALEVLTGRPENSLAPLSDKFPVIVPTPTNRADWVEFALKNNYNLKASKLLAEASHQSAKAAKSRHLPTLSAGLGYRDAGEEGIIVSAPVDQERAGTTANIRLDIPLYSGGETSGRSRQAYAQYTQDQEIYNSTQRSVIQNARSLHLTVETDVARVQARKQAIVSNQSALEATQSGYEVGTRNLVEVLLAQRNLYQARRNYSDALFDYVINSFKLREVAGMLTPADVQAIDKWLEGNTLVNRGKYEQ